MNFVNILPNLLCTKWVNLRSFTLKIRMKLVSTVKVHCECNVHTIIPEYCKRHTHTHTLCLCEREFDVSVVMSSTVKNIQFTCGVSAWILNSGRIRWLIYCQNKLLAKYILRGKECWNKYSNRNTQKKIYLLSFFKRCVSNVGREKANFKW